MAQNVLPLIEIDYYNCIWNKRILTPQSDIQTSTGTSSVPVAVVPGGTGVDADNVYPLGNVYAAPFTGVTSASYPGSAVLNVSWNNQLVPPPWSIGVHRRRDRLDDFKRHGLENFGLQNIEIAVH